MDLILGAMRFGGNSDKNCIAHIQRVFDFSSQKQHCLYTCAADTGEYVSIASKLIVDLDFRHQVGKAYKMFVRDCMSDPAASARVFASHLLE